MPAWAGHTPGFRPGYMMLMREGEGDGAREETALDTLEALMSHFWSCSSSSSCVGPPELTSVELVSCITMTYQHKTLTDFISV